MIADINDISNSNLFAALLAVLLIGAFVWFVRRIR